MEAVNHPRGRGGTWHQLVFIGSGRYRLAKRTGSPRREGTVVLSIHGAMRRNEGGERSKETCFR
jgi:hypothetical protein